MVVEGREATAGVVVEDCKSSAVEEGWKDKLVGKHI